MVTWKEALADQIPDDLGREIDIFETEMDLRRQGKLDEKVFAERRLRRGVYGQRYDNGHRHDGIRTQELLFPSGEITKGPTTLWDAPGMVRIKIPYGGLNLDQLEVLADIAEEYSDGILHVTTRQDIQLHYVHIDDTPNLMRRLAAVGITTREACGNSVRNVTGCPLAGVCHDETFDVTPYAKALANFLLGHQDAQGFGRKFKVAFSGCEQHACGLVMLHDLGFIARTKLVDGAKKRGFTMYVGGGLGAVPHQAKLFDAFVPEEEILPLAQAIARVFARLGEKRNRARARVKFLVAKLGVDEFKRLVLEEREKLPNDPRWTAFLTELTATDEKPLKAATSLNGVPAPEGYDAWAATNVYKQRQEGYALVTITLPLGDLTSLQARAVADIARKYIGETIRLTVDQNIVLRWVSMTDLPALYAELKAVGLGQPGAQSIVDITACPGTDTCKLGISSSRGLAGVLRQRLAAKAIELDQAVLDLKIKISGCFNSCGQHHVADIGFYGVTRKRHGYSVPYFQVVLGGQWTENAGAYGLAVVAVPSKTVPEALDRITDHFVREREKGETFQKFIQRIGKKQVRAWLDDLTEVPPHEEKPEYFSDWGNPREFTMGDLGIGECAGEVITAIDFGLTFAEREVFEAQVALDEGRPQEAADKATGAMLTAARELVRTQFQDIGEQRDEITAEFRARFYDTKLFFDPYAGGKFANYLFRAVETPLESPDADTVHRLVEEAQLFIEAAYSCSNRMAQASAPVK